MAGDPPPDLPLVPLISLGALAAPGGAEVDVAAAFDPQRPRLFALAWLITGGHDGAAAHVVAQTRAQFTTSWTGATDPTNYARLLLVPRACKAARSVTPSTTDVALLDQLLAVPARARAALVLHEALGLDDAAVGQLLEVDRHDAASLARHALGACRFTGVAEMVRATFDQQVARVAAHGLPAPTRPRTRRPRLILGTIVVVGLLAALVGWRAVRRDPSFTPADASVTHYVVLDAASGWQRDSVDAATVDYGSPTRIYVRTDSDGLLLARFIIVPDANQPASVRASSTEQIGDHEIVVEEATDLTTARVRAPCGGARVAAFGVAHDELVAAAATMRCDADGSRPVVPPPGLHERTFPKAERTLVTTSNYRTDAGGFLFLQVAPALIEPEILAVKGAHLVRRNHVRYVVGRIEIAGRDPIVSVRWLLGDASVAMSVLADLDEAAVIDLAERVRAVDEVTFRADPPATTTR